MLSRWLFISLLYLLASFALGLLMVMLLNGSIVNYILTPVFQYTSLFGVLWDDNPLGALQFIITKSIFTFAYKDPRSGLNIWTYDFDGITLAFYIAVSLLAGYAIYSYLKQRDPYLKTGLMLCVAGSALILFAVSYMTAIEHCSGATWVGFVAMYGIGFDEFELYPLWQWLCGVTGIILFVGGAFFLKKPATESSE